MKKAFWIGTLLLFVLCFAGCSAQEAETPPEEAPQEEAALDLAAVQTELEAAIVPPDDIQLPHKSIIAVSAAAADTKESFQTWQKLFELAVKQQGIKVFALEVDFGGARVVNDFVMGNDGDGTAEEVVAELKYGMYQTQEMVDFVLWMKQYNEGVAEEDKLHFYGFDMQRYDNNKNGLFSYLREIDPALLETYEADLEPLNDAFLYNQEPELTEQGLTAISALLIAMGENRSDYLERSTEQAYDLAFRYATCIMNTATWRLSTEFSPRFAALSDTVAWILDYETQYYGNEGMLLASHNSNMRMDLDSTLGGWLAERFGDAFFLIGTEIYAPGFIAWDNDTGLPREYQITAQSEARLATVFHQTGQTEGYLSFADVAAESALGVFLETEQPITSIGGFAKAWETEEMAATMPVIPAKTFDALLLFETTTAATMLQ